ncbi:hypothetical protein CBA19CS22_04130 [Caballeronia novacaledonica]|uniref:Uncharacterized protein n=1 Tax=Caballeronia novacaledonica TaxID=1544861 RepID=A0ACB5QM28_9BURK|nr:hypothetical protein CBA19CS22_04130 [Caballeronia novacaledonica]
MSLLPRVPTLRLVVLSALFVARTALANPAVERSSPERASLSSMPDHYYVGRKDDAFEYAKVPADKGETQDLVLVWYMGTNKDGEPIVRYQDGASSGTLSCFDNCQFVRGATLVGHRLVQTGRIRVTNDPLIYAIMHDARAGRLFSPLK